MSGALSAVELDSFVMNVVLPPGAVLSSNGGGSALLQVGRRAAPGTPDKEEEDSKHGLGGYHGSLHIDHPVSPSRCTTRSQFGRRATMGLRFRLAALGERLRHALSRTE